MSDNVTDTRSRELVERWFGDLFSEGHLSVADEILASEVQYHGPRSLTPQDISGPEGIREYVETYRTAVPDLSYTVEDYQRTDDGAVARWTMTGTQEGDLFDVESSGEAFAESGINVFTVENGRITAVWSEWDTLKMVEELGIVTATETPGE